MKQIQLLLTLWLLMSTASVTTRAQGTMESVYVQTDRSIYMAGEELYYSAFLCGNATQMSRFAYLLVRDKLNHPVIGVRLEFDRQLAYGRIFLPDTLTSGIYQIICYTNYMRNGNEAAFFHREIVIANRFDKDLSFLWRLPDRLTPSVPADRDIDSADRPLLVRADKMIYRPGEKITLTIRNTAGYPSQNLRVSLGISESPADDFIEEAFMPDSKAYRNQCFPKEIFAPVLQGKVIPTGKVETTTSYTLFLSTPDTLANLQVIETDTSGIFCMTQNRYYDGKNVVLRMKESRSATILPDNKFDIPKSFVPSGFFNRPAMRAYLLRCADIVRVRKAYDLQEIADTTGDYAPSLHAPRVYYQPYHRIYPAAYTALPDFAEISRNLVPALRVRKSKNIYQADFLNPVTQGYFDTEPAIFLDGILIDDVNQIVGLGSDQITRIETFPVVRSFGSLFFQGILAVYSSHSAIEAISFKTPTARFKALQSEPHTLPGNIHRDKKDIHEPDLRQVLLWKPDLTLKQGGEEHISCQASDLEGIYCVTATGITSGGQLVNEKIMIIVRSETKEP